jgi:hypothetical protein
VPELDINKTISKDVLKRLFFRESDFRLINSPNPYFKSNGESFSLTKNAKDKISQYIKNHNEHKNEDCQRDEFIRLFEDATALVQELSSRGYEEFNKKIDLVSPLAPPLHWKYQPEYEEYLLINSEQIPENDLHKFYDHYHMLEDLYWFITDNPKKKRIDSYLGDINLGQEFEFQVYSRRWGHYDRYMVYRTLDGWNVDFLMTGGKGDKEGSAIIYCLRHDSINYPTHIGSFFEEIWEFADSKEVAVDKIATLMHRLAEWISITEQGTPELDFEVE